VQDAEGEHFGRGLAEEYAKVKDHYPLCCLFPRVPCAEIPEGSGSEPGFGYAEEEASDHEGGVVGLEGLEAGDGTAVIELVHGLSCSVRCGHV